VRLVDHLKARLVVVPVREVGELIASGAVAINGRTGRIAEPLDRDDIVSVAADAIAAHAVSPQPLALAIHHEDDELLVCEKPAGMHVHPIGSHRTDTLLNALLWHCGARPNDPWGAWRPCPLHRLDRPARGLIAIAKGASNHERLRPLFAAGAIERRYRALVHGRLVGDTGTIDAPLGRDPRCDYRRAIVPLAQGGQHAITHWTVIERTADCSELAIEIETGRTHQIRAHLASIGHPIVGDTLYAAATPSGGGDAASSIELHATELRITRPWRTEPLVVRLRCQA
jgi:23S rRNA pseudouridine1911/1915/1917 synthase